jgi:hypothetical protein
MKETKNKYCFRETFEITQCTKALRPSRNVKTGGFAFRTEMHTGGGGEGGDGGKGGR